MMFLITIRGVAVAMSVTAVYSDALVGQWRIPIFRALSTDNLRA